ncbi:unnamed protein product [Plutella xylostella]|uniref:(diamondback moth) hypothetical protein n=1 Tax=Plutella xylostella TaxID=51655 RepID=A0A8S4E6C9_PLUXY|nr:unnamed protein product [Plutella xylostella]
MWFTIFIVFFIDTGGVYSDNCDVKCSLVHDPVCGVVTATDGTIISINTYHNICHLKKTQCVLSTTTKIKETKKEACNITAEPHRRVADFSILGSEQACNHTCPTYCVDTYEPVCAKIWSPSMKMKEAKHKVMINHCHVDLYSCVTGRNVTLGSVSNCYDNSSRLSFMQQLAALKSLGLGSMKKTPQQG